MQRSLANLIVKVGAPVLLGQFTFDWLSGDFWFAMRRLPTRAILIIVFVMLWAAFQVHRQRRRRTFR